MIETVFSPEEKIDSYLNELTSCFNHVRHRDRFVKLAALCVPLQLSLPGIYEASNAHRSLLQAAWQPILPQLAA